MEIVLHAFPIWPKDVRWDLNLGKCTVYVVDYIVLRLVDFLGCNVLPKISFCTLFENFSFKIFK